MATTITVRVQTADSAQSRIEALLEKGTHERLTSEEMTEVLNLAYTQAFERNLDAMNRLAAAQMEWEAA